TDAPTASSPTDSRCWSKHTQQQPLGVTMDSFEVLWNASGGASLDPARAQHDAIAMAVRQLPESFTDAGFTDDQAWQITKEVALAALLPVAMQQALAEDEDDD